MDTLVRLSLLSQHFKKINKDLAFTVDQATELATKIFGIHVPILYDGTPSKSMGDKPRTFVESLALYDSVNDVVRFYYKRLEYFSKLYGADINSATQFLICHEFGHAKQGRLDEQFGYYSYTTKIAPFPFPVTMDSSTYDLCKVQVSDFSFPTIFSMGISDCAVNNELSKYGLYDPVYAKSFVWSQNTLRASSSSLSELDKHQAILERYLMLPLTIDNYLNKGLDSYSKNLLRNDYQQYLGVKWDYAYEKMKQLDVNYPDSNMKITSDLFEKVLGVNAYFVCLPDFLVFRSGKKKPTFCRKNEYKVLHIFGSYPNKIT